MSYTEDTSGAPMLEINKSGRASQARKSIKDTQLSSAPITTVHTAFLISYGEKSFHVSYNYITAFKNWSLRASSTTERTQTQL
jgi:hypothetical protein